MKQHKDRETLAIYSVSYVITGFNLCFQTQKTKFRHCMLLGMDNKLFILLSSLVLDLLVDNKLFILLSSLVVDLLVDRVFNEILEFLIQQASSFFFASLILQAISQLC